MVTEFVTAFGFTDIDGPRINQSNREFSLAIQ